MRKAGLVGRIGEVLCFQTECFSFFFWLVDEIAGVELDPGGVGRHRNGHIVDGHIYRSRAPDTAAVDNEIVVVTSGVNDLFVFGVYTVADISRVSEIKNGSCHRADLAGGDERPVDGSNAVGVKERDAVLYIAVVREIRVVG